jgi:hypothetical protein
MQGLGLGQLEKERDKGGMVFVILPFVFLNVELVL